MVAKMLLHDAAGAPAAGRRIWVFALVDRTPNGWNEVVLCSLAVPNQAVRLERKVSEAASIVSFHHVTLTGWHCALRDSKGVDHVWRSRNLDGRSSDSTHTALKQGTQMCQLPDVCGRNSSPCLTSILIEGISSSMAGDGRLDHQLRPTTQRALFSFDGSSGRNDAVRAKSSTPSTLIHPSAAC